MGGVDTSASRMMLDHSLHVLAVTAGREDSIDSLSKELQMKSMTTKIFSIEVNGTRDIAKSMVELECEEKEIPERVCRSMALAVQSSGTKYQKKDSVPLSDNQGSLYMVWIWVQEGAREGEVQVALKGCSMNYALRDVVTYTEKVEHIPEIRCEKTVKSGGLFSSSTTTEHCREVATKKETTMMPVFEKATMNMQKIEALEQMMEHKLAKGVLAKVAEVSVSARPALEAAK